MGLVGLSDFVDGNSRKCCFEVVVMVVLGLS
jgi:hypothetical protein